MYKNTYIEYIYIFFEYRMNHGLEYSINDRKRNRKGVNGGILQLSSSNFPPFF